MNHVALLATVAATAFLLPLLVQLGDAVGVPRTAGMAITLGLAVLGALLLWRWNAPRTAAPPAELPDGMEEDRRARI